MPRTGGVYSPPAGTKGTPNTTIQSVPYNTFIDDLTADANAARPVTAGGTGATSASGARTALGVEIGTNVQAYDAGLQSIAGLTTVANQILYTTATDVYATTALTPFARDLLGDANAAAMKTRLGLAAVASSGSANDITSGTLADARLPTSMAGKTFTSNMQSSMGLASAPVEHFRLVPTDFGAGKYGLFFNRTTATKYTISMFDGVNNAAALELVAQSVLWNGNTVMTAAGGTFTGSVSGPDFTSTTGTFVARSNGNRHLFFQTAAGLNRGLVYHDNAGGYVGINTYNTSGTFVRGASFREDGVFEWGGHLQVIDGRTLNTSESRWYTDNNTQFRYIFGADNSFNFQWSSDFYTASFRTIMRGDSAFNVYFDEAPAAYAQKWLMYGAPGGESGVRKGAGDGASFATQNVQFASWWGIGFTSSTDNVTRIVMDPRAGTMSTTGQINIGSAAHFTDGNIQFAGGMLGYGGYLSDALNARAVIYTGTNAGETNFPLGHQVLAYHTTAPVNNSTVSVYTATSNLGYTYSTNAVSLLSGTWRQRGGVQYSSGNYMNQAQRAA